MNEGLRRAINERLPELARRSGRTQEDIAEALGVSVPTVAAWYQGKNLPDIGHAVELCRLLECDLDYLLGNKPEILEAATTAAGYTGLTLEAVAALHGIQDDYKNVAGAIITSAPVDLLEALRVAKEAPIYAAGYYDKARRALEAGDEATAEREAAVADYMRIQQQKAIDEAGRIFARLAAGLAGSWPEPVTYPDGEPLGGAPITPLDFN